MTEYVDNKYLINDKWAKKAYGSEVFTKDASGIIGITAFASLEAFMKTYQSNGYTAEVEVESKKTVLDKAWLNRNSAVYEAFEGPVRLDAHLKEAIDISIDVYDKFTLEDFGTVTVSGGRVYSITIEDDKDSAYSNGACKSEKVAAAGKITIDGGSTVEEVAGYKSVAVSGSNTRVGSLSAYEIDNTYDQDFSFDINSERYFSNLASGKSKASGSAAISKGAVVGSVLNYSKVTVDNAIVENNIRGNSTAYEYSFIDGKFVFTQNDYSSSGDITAVCNQFTVSNKINWDKKSGSNKYSITNKFSGTATLSNGSEAENVINFATVTISGGSTVGAAVSLDLQYTAARTHTVKAIKNSDLVQLVDNYSYTVNRGGKITVKESDNAGTAISGFDSVVLTDSSVGDITNSATDWLSKSYKNTYDIPVDDYKYENFGEDPVVYENSEKLGASGSVKVTVSKKAESGVTVGNIDGYSTVVLTGSGDKKVTVGNITSILSENNSNSSNVVENSFAETINGKENEKRSANLAGSVKLTDVAECGFIEGYKSVTLKNAVIAGANGCVWDDEESEYKFNRSGSLADVYKTESDGTVTYKSVEKDKITVTGSFTATDSEITQDGINGFKTVKLTNTSVAGDVVSAMDSTENYECELVYDSFEDFKNEENASGGWEILETVDKTTGSFTFTLDKKCDQSEDYTIGNIKDFATVKISGFRKGDIDKGVTVLGDITNSGSCGSEGITDHDSNNYSYWEEQTANGSVTLKDHVTVEGGISGFQKVTLSDSVVIGDVYSMDRMAFANEEYNLVYGELTMIDSYIGGDISGFKKFTAKAELNTIKTYTGTAAVEADGEKELNAETVEISKNAVLIAEKIELQAEDKLTVNGELVFWAGAPRSTWAVVADSDNAIYGGITRIEGKGTIYANSEVAGAIKSTVQYAQGKVVDLGSTSYFFCGSAEELSDNKAFNKWDGSEELCGWVGKGEFTDDTDKVIFRWDGDAGAVKEFELTLYGDAEGFEVTFNGKEWDTANASIELAANTDYEFVFKRTNEGATSYMLAEI